MNDDPKRQTITICEHGKEREVIVEVGKEYVIEPRTPGKKRNRGRHCIVLDFVPVSESHPHDIVAKVRYLDNNRVGRAALDELVPMREAAVG